MTQPNIPLPLELPPEIEAILHKYRLTADCTEAGFQEARRCMAVEITVAAQKRLIASQIRYLGGLTWKMAQALKAVEREGGGR